MSFSRCQARLLALLVGLCLMTTPIAGQSASSTITGLVVDASSAIVPDAKVKAAMNDINAAQREQTAAQARGEADKILKVKQAEAEAQSKALQGEGVARQRQAIIQGLQSSVEQFKTAVEGSTARDVMAMVLLTQYFDTLRDIGTAGRSNTILLPNQPGTVNDLLTQIMAGFEASKPNWDGNGAAAASQTASPIR